MNMRIPGTTNDAEWMQVILNDGGTVYLTPDREYDICTPIVFPNQKKGTEK